MLLSTKNTIFLSLLAINSDAVAAFGAPASIIGFEPLTDVRDQNRIDMDQRSIGELMAAGNVDAARKIYELGSHSKSVSLLTVVTPGGIPFDVEQGETLTGTNSAGAPVSVFAQKTSYTSGDTEFSIQYFDEGCYVGPNPTPTLEGCLAASGVLSMADQVNMTFAYEYDPLTSGNVYNIQRFTTKGEYFFAPGNPFTVDFQKFVDFYGSDSYADDIMIAAFSGTSTNFSTGKNVDASLYGAAGQAVIATRISAYMGVWMYVIRELEHAIFLCETGDCEEESCLGKAAVHEVDEAVAFYAGSLEGFDGSGEGVLMYGLADERAAEFRTAGRFGESASGTAKVNHDLLELFESSSAHIVTANCQGVRDETTKIVQVMSIPLVQGTLQYAYLISTGQDTTDKSHAEVAAFAATVLPFVAACSADDANKIYENTKTGAAEVDFQAIKSAFENNYECMGISGEVGGLWNTESDTYFEGAEPQGGIVENSGNSASGGAYTRAIGLVSCFVFGLSGIINYLWI